MCLTTQCLRRAEVTKERILRMGTRYMIISLLYEYIMELNDEPESQKKEFLTRKRKYPFGTDEIKELIISQRDVLNAKIEEMTELLESQEREEKKKLVIVEEHRVEVAPVRVHEKGEESEAGGLVDDRHYWEIMVNEVAEQSSDDTRDGEESSDDEYRPVDDEESNDDKYQSKNGEPSPKGRRIEASEPPIRKKWRKMVDDLKRFPFRDRRDQSLGVSAWRRWAFCGAEGDHYSDACPRIRNGNVRLRIVEERGLCIV
nr:unnamed protein product [Haemonchus contortus]